MEKISKTPEREVRDWVAAFERDPPLFAQFPVTLRNARTIPGVHLVCSTCNGRISGDRVRGRVVQSLPGVITVTANGMCVGCERLTHIDCRFRSDEQSAVLEWLANGRWQARPMQPESIRMRIVDAFRRLLTRLSSRWS